MEPSCEIRHREDKDFTIALVTAVVDTWTNQPDHERLHFRDFPGTNKGT